MHLILERKSIINLHDLHEKYGHLLDTPQATDSLETFQQLVELQQVYSAAMNEISTKLEILDDEFQIRHSHNPIHHMECRLKNPRSIIDKLNKHGLSADFETARERLHDIAGIRVICNYVEDVYAIEKMLLGQSDIQLVRRKDYIEKPKPNGYRSLHIIVSVPVFLSDQTEVVPVEIQIRTISMDMWASLEHKLRYKNDRDNLADHAQQLQECADQLAAIEKTMQRIHNEIA